jgi:hypothetical protein
MPVLIIGGGVAVLLLVLFGGGASKVQAGLTKAGIGGTPTSGVKAFPTGELVKSISSIGTSIFGGAGTHNPADTTIRSPGATGSSMIVSGAANDPTRIPDSSKIITTLEENQSTGGTTVGAIETEIPSVSADDFSVDAGYWND